MKVAYRRKHQVDQLQIFWSSLLTGSERAALWETSSISSGTLFITHFLPQNSNLLLQLSPKHISVQVRVFIVQHLHSPHVFEQSLERSDGCAVTTGSRIHLGMRFKTLHTHELGVFSRDCEQAGDHSLLQISKGEVRRYLGNCWTDLIWKVQVLVVFELALPVLDVGLPLFLVRVGEEEFAVEARGPLRNAWIQAV